VVRVQEGKVRWVSLTLALCMCVGWYGRPGRGAKEGWNRRSLFESSGYF
jgi:hypothetical protein